MTTDIPDAQTPDPESAVPEQLHIGAPFIVIDDVEVEDRGGDACPHCAQPAVSGSTSILRCDCGQLFRIDLLDNVPKNCPACERVYTHVLIVCASDNPEAFVEAVAVVLRANGYAATLPSELDEEEDLRGSDDDDSEEEDEDEERDAVEDDAEEPRT